MIEDQPGTGQPDPERALPKGCRSGVDGLLLGAVLAGGLSFAAGFFLPMWLMPTSNQGPLTGCFIGPFAALAGAVLGQSVVRMKTLSFLRSVLIGVLAGMGMVVFLYRGNFSHLRSAEGWVMLGCGAVIFGITGAATWLARPSSARYP